MTTGESQIDHFDRFLSNRQRIRSEHSATGELILSAEAIFRFDSQDNVVFKVETHNHPSALEP